MSLRKRTHKLQAMSVAIINQCGIIFKGKLSDLLTVYKK